MGKVSGGERSGKSGKAVYDFVSLDFRRLEGEGTWEGKNAKVVYIEH
jgi:hypothetical protein